jgi:transposase
MDSNDEAWKVFWCEHLSPVMLGEIPEGQREAYFRTLSQRQLLVPGGKMRRFSVRTWRRRWTELKTGGVAALGQRRRRSDRGRPRWPHAELLQRAEQLKREQPRRSDQVINRILRREFGREVPRSTLYRHLKRVGATRRKLGVAREKIRCRWTRDHSNAL